MKTPITQLNTLTVHSYAGIPSYGIVPQKIAVKLERALILERRRSRRLREALNLANEHLMLLKRSPVSVKPAKRGH